MRGVIREATLLALVLAGCGAGAGESQSSPQSGANDGAGDASDAGARNADAATDVSNDGEDGTPNDVGSMDGTSDAGLSERDAATPVESTGDACMDAALRIAACFLGREESGARACAIGAEDAAPTVARFLIAGGSCPTLISQRITLTTPCDQAPLPQHVMQLVGYAAAAELCTEGPVNSADTCDAACENLPPCVDEKMLDEKLKDAARCYDGCIRNEEDAAAFACSAQHAGDCTALAEQCWTAP